RLSAICDWLFRLPPHFILEAPPKCDPEHLPPPQNPQHLKALQTISQIKMNAPIHQSTNPLIHQTGPCLAQSRLVSLTKCEGGPPPPMPRIRISWKLESTNPTFEIPSI